MRHRAEPGGAPRRVVFTDHGRRRLARATLLGGMEAGLIAGAAMGALAVIQSAWVGLGAQLPLQGIAGVFYGVEAFVAGVGAVLAGLAVHFLVSAALGVIFASMVRPATSVGTAFAGGLLFGGVVWALMTFVILPIFNPVLSARVALISGWWFFVHMVFGGALAVTPTLMRSAVRTGEGRTREERPVRPDERAA